MTPDLEELMRLYAAVLEASAEDQERTLNAFRLRCREMAMRGGLKTGDVEAYAVRAFHKTQVSTDRRTGRR